MRDDVELILFKCLCASVVHNHPIDNSRRKSIKKFRNMQLSLQVFV